MGMRGGLFFAAGSLLLALTDAGNAVAVTVPFTLDHNRMLVDAEIQRSDGSWRGVRLWVDTGNPDFLVSAQLASDLGLDANGSAPGSGGGGATSREVRIPGGVRIVGTRLSFEGVHTEVLSEPGWLFSTTHADANLPSTVLRRYRVMFDYPGRRVTLEAPGAGEHRGVRVPAAVHPATGIVQVDAALDGKTVSFALDNGASYSFASEDVVADLAQRHTKWHRTAGAVGCANIWGWWPREQEWPVIRVPEIVVGGVRLGEVGLVGLPSFFPEGASLGAWYSKKTARPVEGFLGPNALRPFRVEIDYANGAVYLERGAPAEAHDMDLVGVTLRPQPDGSYTVLGVAGGAGGGGSGGVRPGDTLVRIGSLEVKGATMGTVVDALRGRPGEARTLVVERQGKPLRIEATVRRWL